MKNKFNWKESIMVDLLIWSLSYFTPWLFLGLSTIIQQGYLLFLIFIFWIGMIVYIIKKKEK